MADPGQTAKSEWELQRKKLLLLLLLEDSGAASNRTQLPVATSHDEGPLHDGQDVR